ncbi:MAG TPA: DUF2270 domain-containing protein [Aggregatilineales bacterium]|nr:DUF2270 domain-containing protein [Chloroflexota bacterium]HQA69792.1 DUF2270 domain-containing protein [Aggregatilineales bacterium]HQE19472.1 DUF2270 domain-containing protein [Aggregatilineales bacterium]
MSPTPEQEARRARLKAGQEDEPVWKYRGYEIGPREFSNAMVHLYRGEVSRANVWRQRLDSTTNWAVITTGAAFSLAFSSELISHAVIILSNLLVTLFLYIEARRYRYYELWSYRIRLMETDFYAGMLVPPFRPAPDWAETLAENLLHPRFPISMWEALGRRLRRNYLWIYFILGAAWLFSVTLRPEPISSVEELFQQARLGYIPGEAIVGGGLLFYGTMLAIGLLTRGLTEATGEVLPRYTSLRKTLRGVLPRQGQEASGDRWAWFRPSKRRQQLLSQIITDHPSEVSERIMSEMARGVTNLRGTGMYTGEERSVLLCAITVTEVAHLKDVVAEVDPHAMIIVVPAQEVLGKGFGELPH